jgi:hypothetical protein
MQLESDTLSFSPYKADAHPIHRTKNPNVII